MGAGNEQRVDDPRLREAVLDLFHASEAFRRAYADYARSGDAATLEDASRRMDEARSRVVHAQSTPLDRP